MEQIIPPDVRALLYIQNLQINATKSIMLFSASVARALQSLTFLSLSGNAFERIPANVTMINSLQRLGLSNNISLQLHFEDLDTLSGMPCLQVLDIRKMDPYDMENGISSMSIEILCRIRKRFPALHVISNHKSKEEKQKYRDSMIETLANLPL